MEHLTFVNNIEQEVGDGEMREYDLKKVLDDMLEDIDENEEIREYAEEIVWNYAETIGEEVKILCQECKKIYEEMYAELSKFEHNSYANMIALQFAVVGEDRLGLNINGNNVTAIERILEKVLYILVPMEALFSRVIFEGDVLDCSLPEDEFGQEMWSFAMVLHTMVSDLAQKYFQDSEEN